MKLLLKIFGAFLLGSLFLILDLLTREFFPFPLNQLNMFFLIMALILIVTGRVLLSAIVLPASMLLELFSSVPFGTHTAALLLSLMLMSRLIFTVFTNRSLFIVAATSFIGLLSYRLSFTFFLLLATGFRYNFFSAQLFLDWLFEFSIICSLLTGLYFATTFFFKRLKPEYIKQYGR